MCRALIYLGQPILLADLLFRPDSSLINQAYMPKMLDMLNLAGFGMMAWDRASHDPETPYRYSAPSLPVFDRNLKSLALKTRARTLVYTTGLPPANVAAHSTKPGCWLDLIAEITIQSSACSSRNARSSFL